MEEEKIPDFKGELRQLSERDINKMESEQIASNPKYIIKELIENSLDADSTKISINLVSNKFNKEIKEIRITDNGNGIPKKHFSKICERRYTTKKNKLSSFGYRGEALSFISQNCKLEIRSSTGGIGFEAQFLEGKFLPYDNGDTFKKVSMNQGTSITLKEIFFDNPVLKTRLNIGEDSKKIKELIWSFSLCHNFVKFSLFKNDMSIFSNQLQVKTPSFEDYVLSMVDEHMGYRMTAEDYGFKKIQFDQDNDLSLSIFFSRCNIPVKEKKTVLFYNGRVFRNKDIEDQVNLAYYRAANSINDSSRSYFLLGLFTDSSDKLDKNIEIDTCSKKEAIFIEGITIVSAVLGANLENFLKELAGYRIYEQEGAKRKKKSFRQSVASQQYNKQRHDPDSSMLTQYYAKTPMESSLKKKKETQMTLTQFCMMDSRKSGKMEEEERGDKSQEKEDSTLHESSGDLKQQSNKIDNLFYQKFGEEYFAELEQDTSNKMNSFLKDAAMVGILNALQLVVQHGTRLYVVKTSVLLEKWMMNLWFGNVQFTYKTKNKKNWKKEIFLENLMMSLVKVGIIEEERIENLIKTMMQVDTDNTWIENFGVKLGLDFIELTPTEEFFGDLDLRQKGISHQFKIFNIKEEFFNSPYFWAFLIKLLQEKDSRLEAISKAKIETSLKLLTDYFCLYLLQFLQDKTPGDEEWEMIEGFYQRILRELKEGKFIARCDFESSLEILVDLKKTYETFERCH